jgi:hypothetical protein
LTFRVGTLANLLPTGMSAYTLADALTAHMRALRGYRWAISGYHAAGGGFWLSAACYTDSLYLVDGSRNRNNQSSVDLLIEAFTHKVMSPNDPRMLDPLLYSTETVYIDFAAPITTVRSKQDILAAPQCSVTPKQGFRRIALVEFLPLAAANPAVVQTSTPPPLPRELKIGDTCSVCGAVVMERPLFSGTFVGCLC